MRFTFWQDVPPSTDLASLRGLTLLVADRNGPRAYLCTLFGGRDNISLRWSDLPSLSNSKGQALRNGTFHERVAKRLHMDHLDYEVIVVPDVDWYPAAPGFKNPGVWKIPLMALVGTAIIAGALATGSAGMGAAALPVAALAAWLVWLSGTPKTTPRLKSPGSSVLDGSNLLGHARARRDGLRPELPRTDQRRHGARARCEGIRAEYGALSSDIAYRIENSALFDSAVPTTSDFLQSLVRFEDGAADLGVDDVEELAVELEISFATAKDHAETIGWAHLPSTAQPDARRAAKAARLAASAATDGERTAALGQVIRILDSLALYYLPGRDVVRGELTSGPPPSGHGHNYPR